MMIDNRSLVLDIYDYAGNKVCPLYDSSLDISGQAVSVMVTTERNGWKEISFSLPGVCATEEGVVPNFRLDYLKNDYRIRALFIGEEETIDWYILSEQQIKHDGKSKSASVVAGHISQTLKTKNMGLVFSDTEGNNVGTAEDFIKVILAGTGWTPGNIATFYEKDKKTIKKRSLVAAEKQGAFKLISAVCDLFDAKPVYNGDKTVDIVPMNPFVAPENGELPAVQDDHVLELHYGHELKNVSRKLNSENLLTALFPRGAWGDNVNGYCGIEECKHKEYTYTAPSNGSYARFIITDNEGNESNRWFTPSGNISGHTFRFIDYDPASNMMIWDVTSSKAYRVSKEQDESISSYITLTKTGKTNVVNNMSSVMCFDYYNQIGLVTDDMIQALGEYYNLIPTQKQAAKEASEAFAGSLNDLSKIVGSVDYCRLNVARYDLSDTYAKIRLNRTTTYPKGVIWRTDYTKKEDKQFAWRTADTIRPNGDPLNGVASTLYILHQVQQGSALSLSWSAGALNTIGGEITQSGAYRTGYVTVTSDTQIKIKHPSDCSVYFYNSSNAFISGVDLSGNDTSAILVPSSATKFRISLPTGANRTSVTAGYKSLISWEKTYLKEMDDPEDPTVLTLWLKSADMPDTASADRVYLFWTNNINGYIGSLESADEAATTSINNVTKLATVQHPVYVQCDIPSIDNTVLQGFGWFIDYGSTSSKVDIIDRTPPVPYFCWYAKGDRSWCKVNFISAYSSSQASGQYYYDWKRSLLYKGTKAFGDSVEERTVITMFSTIWQAMTTKDKLYRGQFEFYSYRCPSSLPAGNYAFLNDDRTLICFTTTTQLNTGDKLVYDSSHRWVTQFRGSAETTLEIKSKKIDGVEYPLTNVVDGLSVYAKYKLNSDGTQTAVENGTTDVSNYFRVKPNVTYTVAAGSANVKGYAFYNAKKLFVSYSGSSFTSVTSPSAASFMKIVVNTGTINTVVIRDTNYLTNFYVKDISYKLLDNFTGYGTLKGMMPMWIRFADIAERAYTTELAALTAAQDAVTAAENNMKEAFGDLYKEGYYQRADYVNGDEDKLFDDALEDVQVISEPTKTYTVGFLDLYGSNAKQMYYAHRMTDIVEWPTYDPSYAVHLVDPDFNINEWAYIDKSVICYDMPWKSTITINTDLSTIAQHSFADVLANVVNLAQMQNETQVYERAKVLSKTGQLAAARLEGVINSNTTLLANSTSTMYTTENGAWVFEAVDQSGAMMITGNGFSVASEKNADGTWRWRTFGTGAGFSADELITGYLSAERIEAGSITTEHLSPAVGETLDITANSTIQGLQASISISSEGIQQRVQNLEQKYETTINTYADKWNAMVTSGTNGNFNSLFEQQANKITTFVRNDAFHSKFVQEAKNITLEANQININGATFDSTGKLTLTAGNLGGWQVAKNQLYAGSGAYRVGMQSIATSGSVSFYAGSETPTNAPFRVTNTGDVYAASFQGMGYVEAEKGKIGRWYIYPTSEEYYKKWVVTEYEQTEYNMGMRGDIWTSGQWQANSYSTLYTYYVGLHATEALKDDLFTFYSGFKEHMVNTNDQRYLAIDCFGGLYSGHVDDCTYINSGHTTSMRFTYGKDIVMLNNQGSVLASRSVIVGKADVSGNVVKLDMSSNLGSWNGSFLGVNYNGTDYAGILLGIDTNHTVTIYGDLAVTGNSSGKSRLVTTEHFGDVALSAYETTTPTFADIGESQIGEQGSVRIYIDPVFAETIVLEDSYQVFLQKYGSGECFVSERNSSYFEVQGTPGLKFAWEMKAKQIGIDQRRLYKHSMISQQLGVGNHNYTDEADYISQTTDYGAQGAQYAQEQSA